ncbi:unnamed protein product [Linum tenue]|uniref:peptide-methionine (S)-S-oxide reductase n=1 Tax=Linum tenue TaxID=586396 RepID=A0AAV0MUC0_9ROSI|nr:unnamed protein product [Linum tenue]
MLHKLAAVSATTTTSPVLLLSATASSSSALSNPFLAIPKRLKLPTSKPLSSRPISRSQPTTMNILNKLGFGVRSTDPSAMDPTIPQSPDDDSPAPGQQFAQFGAGCFWGVELVFQRVSGVTKTEVGYTQGLLHNPTYEDICTGTTSHSEVVRVQFDPKECSYDALLDVFWARHDPTTMNRQVGNDVGTQYRSGIYYYTPEQEKAAKESMERHQKAFNRKIVTEILPAKKFYRAEEYHQQYLAKGGRFGFKQSTEKGCNDPIRCYG